MDKAKALAQLRVNPPGKYTECVEIDPGHPRDFVLELVNYSVSEEWNQPMAVGQVEQRAESLLINVSVRMKEKPPEPVVETADEGTSDLKDSEQIHGGGD